VEQSIGPQKAYIVISSGSFSKPDVQRTSINSWMRKMKGDLESEKEQKIENDAKPRK
jgi:hypothetical protein